MRVIPGIVTILVVACTASAFSPLQFQRNQGFPLHSEKADKVKSSLQNSFTKALLPREVLPVSYDLLISPILDAGVGSHVVYTAPGSVTIVVKAVTASQVITLNSVGITINEATITVKPVDTADTTVFAVTGAEDVAKEFYVLTLDVALTPEKEYSIFIEFIARVETKNDRLSGLYRSGFINPAGAVSYIATTQFEATAARQAFPCFDEPSIKATFKVSIGYNAVKYKTALSNGVLEETVEFPELGGGADWKKNVFKETVPMSSYLVALVVGDFNYVSATEGLFDKEVRVYATTSKDGGGQYAADTAAEFLKFFQDHYEIAYRLDKMDSVAMPDFEFGAMENYGLNIYREAYLLNFPGVTSESERELITLVLSHELAHQWFGNLVTCQFWDQIWLNEGFATYNENIAVEVVKPEYKSASTKQNDIVQVALTFDANPALTHPLVNGASPDDSNVELMTNFDRITYQKGGSLVYMMEGFLGEATFKQGLTNYLNGKEYQAAHQDDLFNVLTVVAHDDNKLPADITVKDIMDTWTLQTGFPLVRVTKASNTKIYVTQERFSESVVYTEGHELNLNELWTIPVAVATAAEPVLENHEPAFWINKDVLLKSATYDTTKWVLVNAGSTGYYRVLYDSPLTTLLVNQFETDASVIVPISRSQLIDDYFTFAAHKFTDIETALSFTKYLRKEAEIVVWNTVLTHLRGILNKLASTGDAYTAFKAYWLPRLGDTLTAIGAEQQAADTGALVVLRAQLLDWACALEQTECRAYATRLFGEWVAAPATNPIPIDIRPIVYCAAVAAGGDDTTFNEAKTLFTTSTSAKDKGLLLNALACTVDATLLNTLLAEVTAPTYIIPVAQRITLLQRLAANPESRLLVINLLKTSAGIIINALKAQAVIDAVGTLSAHVGTASELDDIKVAITSTEDRFTDEEKEVLNNYFAVIEANIVWRTENDARLTTWFNENIE